MQYVIAAYALAVLLLLGLFAYNLWIFLKLTQELAKLDQTNQKL